MNKEKSGQKKKKTMNEWMRDRKKWDTEKEINEWNKQIMQKIKRMHE